jgi:hypothetical protein
MAQDYRLSALERQIASRSTREYAKLGKGLSRGMRGLGARGLIGSSEQEELLADIAERKALVESESTAQRDMLRDQITQEEEAKRGANLRNALSIGGTLLGAGVGLAFALPTGGLSVAAGLSGGAGLGSALGKIVGGGVTGTWDPTAANDIVTGFDALTKVDPVEELDKKLKLIRTYLPGSGYHNIPADVGTKVAERLHSGLPMDQTFIDSIRGGGLSDYTIEALLNLDNVLGGS